jgi:hypothetical protein
MGRNTSHVTAAAPGRCGWSLSVLHAHGSAGINALRGQPAAGGCRGLGDL